MVNWVKFGLTAAYGLIVFIFFFLYIAGAFGASNLSNDILYVGFLVMLGILLNMVASMSDNRPSSEGQTI